MNKHEKILASKINTAFENIKPDILDKVLSSANVEFYTSDFMIKENSYKRRFVVAIAIMSIFLCTLSVVAATNHEMREAIMDWFRPSSTVRIMPDIAREEYNGFWTPFDDKSNIYITNNIIQHRKINKNTNNIETEYYKYTEDGLFKINEQICDIKDPSDKDNILWSISYYFTDNNLSIFNNTLYDNSYNTYPFYFTPIPGRNDVCLASTKVEGILETFILDLKTGEYSVIFNQAGKNETIKLLKLMEAKNPPDTLNSARELSWADRCMVSPNGEKILFHTKRDYFIKGDFHGTDVYVYNVSTKEEEKIFTANDMFEVLGWLDDQNIYIRSYGPQKHIIYQFNINTKVKTFAYQTMDYTSPHIGTELKDGLLDIIDGYVFELKSGVITMTNLTTGYTNPIYKIDMISPMRPNRYIALSPDKTKVALSTLWDEDKIYYECVIIDVATKKAQIISSAVLEGNQPVWPIWLDSKNLLIRAYEYVDINLETGNQNEIADYHMYILRIND